MNLMSGAVITAAVVRGNACVCFCCARRIAYEDLTVRAMSAGCSGHERATVPYAWSFRAIPVSGWK